MSTPIDWRPGMRALCVNAGDTQLRHGALYLVTAVHASSIGPVYLALAPDKLPEWLAGRFMLIVPACDKPRRGPTTLEAHDDFWKDAD